VKPIEYNSPDGETWVKIEAIPAYGMATIWDADILIWAASTLHTTSYELLHGIKRDTSGRAYQELQAAL
jgi:plasmid replication initiation protein